MNKQEVLRSNWWKLSGYIGIGRSNVSEEVAAADQEEPCVHMNTSIVTVTHRHPIIMHLCSSEAAHTDYICSNVCPTADLLHPPVLTKTAL